MIIIFVIGIMLQKQGTFIRKKYKSLLISAFFAYLFCLISEFIDSTIGSNFLPNPTKVISAIEVVSPIFQLILFASCLISVGTATLYDHYLGKFEEKKAHTLFGQSIIVSLIISVIMTIIMCFCKNAFLQFFGCETDVYDLANDYYFAYIFMAFLYPQYWLLYFSIHNEADAVTCFISDNLQLVSHVAISIILVECTSLGIKGLSLGAFFAVLISYLILFIHFFKKNNSLKASLGFNGNDLIKTMLLGAPSTFTYLFVAIVDIILNKHIVDNFGDSYLTAYSMINLVLNLATVYTNLGESAIPFNSVYFEENNYHGIRKVMKCAYFSSFVEGALFTIIFLSLANYFPMIYNLQHDPLIYEESIFICRILSITMIPTAFLFLFISYYPSIKKEGYSFLLSTLYMLVLPLALSYLFMPFCGFKGIAIGIMLVPVFSFIIFIIILIISKKFKFSLLLLPNDIYITDSFDIALKKENLISLLTASEDFLNRNNIKKEKIQDVLKLIESSYLVIFDNNVSKKKNLGSELDILINNQEIVVTIRDNGLIFNMCEPKNDNIKVNSEFKEALKNIKSYSYLVTTSFNRNAFYFSN